MSTLYPFQQLTVDLFSKGRSALLADDMGLGKTVQAIALDKRKRELYGAEFSKKGKLMTLVVAPLSTLGAWAKHFKEWQPDLKVEVINTKARGAFTGSFTKGRADVYICHWESLRLMPELGKVLWFNVIGDEIHRIKNRKSVMASTFKKIHTEHKLGMSGTPADNKPDDLWSVLNWLWPRTFTSYNAFCDRHIIMKWHTKGYCTADDCLQGYHQNSFKEILGTAHVEEVHAAMEGQYLRRLKKDLLKELPDKYTSEMIVDLTPIQRRAYDSMRDDMIAWVGQHEQEPCASPAVISQLIRLQQFACAYGQMVTVTRRRKDCEECRLEAELRAIATGTPLPEGPVKCLGHDSLQLQLTNPSSKIDAIAELIEDHDDQPFVVFGQSKQVARLLHDRLQSKGISSALFTGDTPATARTEIVDSFQAGRIRAFVGTIAAGGTGITLTRASTVVFIDHAWSPSWNRQAEDRLHRIGQKNAVHVIKVIATDTIDAQRIEQIETKWEWLREILGDKKK